MKKYYLKEEVDFERLKEFNYKISECENIKYAKKEIYTNSSNYYYLLSVNSRDKIFKKTKIRIYKVNLGDRVTKKDIQDLIEANLVEEREN